MQVNSSTCPRQNAWVVQRAVQTLLTLFGTLVLCPDAQYAQYDEQYAVCAD